MPELGEDDDRALAALAEANRTELLNLSIDLRQWFALTGDPTALDEAATAVHAALRAPPVDDATASVCLFELMVVHRTRFDHAGDPDDLREAADAGRAAVAAAGATDRDDAAWPLHQGRLAAVLRARWETSSRLEFLDEAIAVLNAAVRSAPPAGEVREALLGAFTSCWGARTNLRAQPVDDVVATAGWILESAGPGDPARSLYLSNVSAALMGRYERDGNGADLDAAVAATRQARAIRAPQGADSGLLASSARRVFTAAYRRDHEPDLLDAAIEAGRAAADAMAATGPDLGPELVSLATLLGERFGVAGTADDLDEIVDCGERSVRAPAADATVLRHRKTILATDLRKRYARTGSRSDLKRTVALLGELAGQPATDDELGRAQSALVAESLYSLGDRLADLTGRQHAVAAARRDFQTAGDGRLAETRHRLGRALWREFQLTGNVAELEEAITHSRALVDLVDEVDRSAAQANLGRQLRALYDRGGDLAVLRDAVQTLDHAMRDAAPDDPQTGAYFSSAANVLADFGRRTGQPHLARMALGLHRDAVAMTAEDDPGFALRLANLCQQLSDEFRRSNDPALLTEAVDGLRRALEALPPEHLDRPSLLTNLSSMLRNSFRSTGDPAELEAAVGAARTALDHLPAGHQVRAGAWHNLALALTDRFERSGTPEDLDEALAAFRQTAGEEQAPPDLRARSATAWGVAAREAGRTGDAVDGFACAVELLPMVSGRDRARGDQEHFLVGYTGLASLACAAALDAGDPDRAVALLEGARGVLLAQALETRGEVTDLAVQYPALAAEFAATRRDLTDGPPAGDEPAEVVGRSRRGRADAWRQLLARIRQLPSFDRFLLPPTLTDLLTDAAHGPVILVSASPTRSDALALTTAGVRHVPLPGLSSADTHHRVREFTAALTTVERPGLTFVEYYEANQAMAGVLSWLWDVAAGPVLDALGCTGEKLQRVWWVPTGELASLPWHAAGHHEHRDDRPAPTVLDRVVSSYAPTVRTLHHLRTRLPRRELTAAPVLVGVSDAPGATPLPGVRTEIAHLAARLPHAVVLRDGQATRDRVLGQLERATLAHFACHGVSVPDQPSSSRLLVHDHADRPLTVSDIARLRLDHAQLAFLSACSTARASTRLTDEAIHITSAFQLAGYPHVIGTLWTVDDLAAVELTERVYDGLPGEPSRALHAAVRAARDRDPDRPARWAAHVHAGV